jgi:hypothetical protein
MRSPPGGSTTALFPARANLIMVPASEGCPAWGRAESYPLNLIRVMPARGTEKTLNLISLLKEKRLTLGEVEFLEPMLDKDQEILWSGRPHRPFIILLLVVLFIWALVSAGHIWMGTQNGESLVLGLSVSLITLALAGVGIWIVLALDGLKPNILVTADKVIHTTALLRQVTSLESIALKATLQQGMITRSALVKPLTSDTSVRVTKNAEIGSLVIESPDASRKHPETKPLKLSGVRDPENLRQIILQAIAAQKLHQESSAQ